VAGGGGGAAAASDGGLEPTVVAAPHYRVRVWGRVQRQAPLMTPSIEASGGGDGYTAQRR
jgi:hypothetical protein